MGPEQEPPPPPVFAVLEMIKVSADEKKKEIMPPSFCVKVAVLPSCSEHVRSFNIAVRRLSELEEKPPFKVEQRRGAAGPNSPATSNVYQKLHSHQQPHSNSRGRRKKNSGNRRTVSALAIQITEQIGWRAAMKMGNGCLL